MGLEPLEFAECLTDSPGFREKLHDHEKELERTSKAIKALIGDGKEVLAASKSMYYVTSKLGFKREKCLCCMKSI